MYKQQLDNYKNYMYRTFQPLCPRQALRLLELHTGIAHILLPGTFADIDSFAVFWHNNSQNCQIITFNVLSVFVCDSHVLAMTKRLRYCDKSCIEYNGSSVT